VRPPGLTVIIVGDDPASRIYVSMKEKACRKTGIRSDIIRLESHVSMDELLRMVRELNADDTVDGILCQLPLPGHLRDDEVASSIVPEKDVDGFHPVNVGRLWRGEDGLFPCTPTGIVSLLDHYGISMDGARAVVVGRSNIVGKPMAGLLLRRHATVTLAHSHTRDLESLCRSADIIVSAVGTPGLITEKFVKPGATIIDVGMNRTDEGLVGDVAFEDVKNVCGAITPVPGGVGPLTIAFLLRNTVESWRRRVIAE
jgi:methylenetetrahydrofolate dehydrogenase (NADP+)/methenyltetrahydrofolate cyclohydrolase